MFIIMPKINSQTVKFITAKTSYTLKLQDITWRSSSVAQNTYFAWYINFRCTINSLNPTLNTTLILWILTISLHHYKERRGDLFSPSNCQDIIQRNGIFKCFYQCLNLLGTSLPPTRSRSRSESSSFLCLSTASSGSLWSIRSGLCPVPGSAMLQQPEPDLQPTTDLPLSLPQQQFHFIICFSHQSNPRAAIASAL